MGLDRGRPVLRAACALVAGGLLAVALAPAAAAQDPTPAPDPMSSRVANSGAAPASNPASNPASTLPPPSQQQIDDAKNALNRMRGSARSAPTTPTTLTQVAAPVGGTGRTSVASRISDQAWWTLGAALLVVLVLSESTRISVRRAKHRKA